jgi:hypothetical protein
MTTPIYYYLEFKTYITLISQDATTEALRAMYIRMDVEICKHIKYGKIWLYTLIHKYS